MTTPSFTREEIVRTKFVLTLPSGDVMNIDLAPGTPKIDEEFVQRLLTLACASIEKPEATPADDYSAIEGRIALHMLQEAGERYPIVGLKELLDEVYLADAALSTGDTVEALVKIRTAWVCANLVRQHAANRAMLEKPVKIAQVVRGSATGACYLDFGNGADLLDYVGCSVWLTAPTEKGEGNEIDFKGCHTGRTSRTD